MIHNKLFFLSMFVNDCKCKGADGTYICKYVCIYIYIYRMTHSKGTLPSNLFMSTIAGGVLSRRRKDKHIQTYMYIITCTEWYIKNMHFLPIYICQILQVAPFRGARRKTSGLEVYTYTPQSFFPRSLAQALY